MCLACGADALCDAPGVLQGTTAALALCHPIPAPFPSRLAMDAPGSDVSALVGGAVRVREGTGL